MQKGNKIEQLEKILKSEVADPKLKKSLEKKIEALKNEKEVLK